MKQIIFICFLFLTAILFSQIHAPAITSHRGHKYTLGVSISSGIMLQRNAYFVGGTIDFSKYLNDYFTLTTSLTYDKEIDKTNMIDAITNTFSFIGAVSYTISNSIVVSTGLSKGFIDDGSKSKKMNFTNGDLSTGLSFGYSFPNLNQSEKMTYSLSTAIEYNISKSEYSTSIDLGVGFSF